MRKGNKLMKRGLLEIIFILDCSGSINRLEKVIFDGFNDMFNK